VSEQRKPAEEYVVIRHRPGYRLRRTAILLVFTVVAAVVGYAAGLAQGGFRFSSAEESNHVLENEVEKLRDDYRKARQQLINLERGQAIDEQALNQARKTIVDLETRIVSLQSDLTFYKNIMAPSETSKGLQVDSLSLVRARNQDSYDFKLVLTQVGNNKSYISGVVAVNVIGLRDEEKEVIALRDLSEDIADLGVKFRFRYFQDVEGSLKLPEQFEPLEIQVVAQAEGKKSSQAERTFNWDDLTEN
jgi:cell division protein FtsB